MKKNLINRFIILLFFFPLKVIASDDNPQVTITLTNGDILNGTLIENKSSDSKKVLDHPQLGELTISQSEIKNLVDDTNKKSSNTLKVANNENSSDDLDSSEKKANIDSDSSALENTLSEPKWSGSFSWDIDADVTHESFAETFNLDFTLELDYKNNSWSNTLTLDYENEKDFYKDDENINQLDVIDTKTLDIEFARDRYIDTKNLTTHLYIYHKYDSEADFGQYDNFVSIGLTKYLFKSDNKSFYIKLGPGIQNVYGGDDCNTVATCGETFFARAFTADFTTNLGKYLSLELNNLWKTAYVSEIKYGNDFTGTLTFRANEDSPLSTSIIYENLYTEVSDPHLEHQYSLRVGYDF